MDVVLRTELGDFDLIGNEAIVQTLGIFNFEDILGRSGDYSNVFTLPLTNNNRKIVEYASFITSVNTTPYKKIATDLILSGLIFKRGLFIVDEISDTIKGRFISGNATFYNILGGLTLQDLDWDEYYHLWNLTNAVASSANTYGYTYPVLNYGGQTIASDTIDIRKILPATFNRTILDKIFSKLDYTAVFDCDTTDFDISLLPYCIKNPEVSAAIQLASSVDVNAPEQYALSYPLDYKIIYSVTEFGLFNGVLLNYGTGSFTELHNDLGLIFTDVVTPNSSNDFNFSTQQFTASVAGVYDISMIAELLDYDCIRFDCDYNHNGVLVPTGYYDATSSLYLKIYKWIAGEFVEVASVLCNTGERLATNGTYYAIENLTQTFITNNLVTSMYLGVGDILSFGFKMVFGAHGLYVETLSGTIWNTQNIVGYRSYYPTIKANSSLQINLQEALVFGGPITYNQMLPKIKGTDYLKDMCIRFGFIINVNEEERIVTVSKFQKLYDNIPTAVDWSDKLDEDSVPNIRFSYNSYAKNNLIKHAEDKTVVVTPLDSDYTLIINNENLELQKIIYTSPFAVCEDETINSYASCKIDLYNTTSGKFNKDIKYRICFTNPVTSLFKFTDGTTTSGFINVNVLYFSDINTPSLSMGFSMNLINKNSILLIETLQNLKIVTINSNLNLIDIKSIDYLTPVYISQFQSYFFISSINQFDYTNPGLTEVELIKLNK